MQLNEIHGRLANTAMIFIAVLGIWALILRIRSKPLDGNWYGAAIIGELLIIGQAIIGTWIYLQGLGAALPRPYLHILYGLVAVLSLPAAYGYFSLLEDENVQTVAMVLVCFFLWGILLRASNVTEFIQMTMQVYF